eukprot:scaffold4532_cov81-Cylindrotheca_fusiformis.AAC.1
MVWKTTEAYFNLRSVLPFVINLSPILQCILEDIGGASERGDFLSEFLKLGDSLMTSFAIRSAYGHK